MSTLNLGSMFQATSSAGIPKGKRAPLTRFTKKAVITVMPESAKEEARDCFALYLMLCGTSQSTDIEEWKNYIATYTAFVTPSMASQFPKEIYNMVPMAELKVNTLGTAYTGYTSSVGASEDGASEKDKLAFLQGATIPGLPRPNTDLPWHEGYMEVVPKIVVSHYSIVLFLMSKRVEKGNHDPISAKRPLALRGKAHITDVCAFLDGTLRLSDESHLLINSAWAESAALRALSIREYATYQEMETDINQDLIFTSMHLMKFGNMSHAKITYNFLKAHEWADEVPALRGAIGVYRDSIQAASKHPEYLRPYLKLIYGDKLGIFPRNELEVLIDCAVAEQKANNPTLEDFFVSDRYSAVVEAFLSEKEKRTDLRTRTLDQQVKKVTYESDEEDPEDYSEVEGDH